VALQEKNLDLLKYHLEPHDVPSSVARIKDSFWFYFSELVSFVLSVFLYLLYYFMCSVMYFIVYAVFVRIKLMMIMNARGGSAILESGFKFVSQSVASRNRCTKSYIET